MANQGNERGNSGNFANDPERASEAGRKGGRTLGGRQAPLSLGRTGTRRERAPASRATARRLARRGEGTRILR
jgi:uncharacterized protein